MLHVNIMFSLFVGVSVSVIDVTTAFSIIAARGPYGHIYASAPPLHTVPGTFPPNTNHTHLAPPHLCRD